MPDDQFICSSSWLPSPRFELRTLAGYTTWQKPEILHRQKLGCLHRLTWSQQQLFYRGADKSLARPTSQYILFDASLVICINSTNIPPIMIINRIYGTQNVMLL